MWLMPQFVFSQAPVINAHPQSRTVNPGESATFSVTASGGQPLRYQWRLNGQSIPGATFERPMGIAYNPVTHDLVVTDLAGRLVRIPVPK